MKVTLTVVAGPHEGSTFAFDEHDAFLVGRSPQVQFRLPLRDKTLSRVHFLVEVNPPSCRLMDMASTNGVRVNGKRVLAADLRHGDEIEAGRTTLSFAVEGDGLDDLPLSLASTLGSSPGSSSLSPAPVPSPETADWAGGSGFPGYQVERKLGEGGMGVVYLARREADGTAVALKVIRPAVSASEAVSGRFLREAGILRKLEHAHIVRFLDIGFSEGRLYFAMQYVDGKTVAESLKARGPFSIPAAVGLARHVLRGLGHAHSLGFVHRDIKPENILTTRRKGKARALLADFGLARVYHESSLSGLSMTGQIGGTLAYMPPEQITHFRDVRPPADLYSLGATLYMLLTGKTILDFQGRPERQVARILFEEPTPIQAHRPEIPDGLAAAIHKALAKSPGDRFADALAMKDALTPYAGTG
jgi:serine/threonine-protein kinase